MAREWQQRSPSVEGLRLVVLAGSDGEGGDNRVVVTGKTPRGEAIGEHGGVVRCQTTDWVAVADPVDTVVVGFARYLGPGCTMEAMERHDTGAVGVPTRLPTVDEPVCA